MASISTKCWFVGKVCIRNLAQALFRLASRHRKEPSEVMHYRLIPMGLSETLFGSAGLALR
jgi:hypothetical protein